MNDIFPALERHFKADTAGCVKLCRKLYQIGDNPAGPSAFVRWTEDGGENLDSFGTDCMQHNGQFTLFSVGPTMANVRRMADAITRHFDDTGFAAGGFARISCHRQGPPLFDQVDGIFMATIPYIAYAELATETPAGVIQ